MTTIGGRVQTLTMRAPDEATAQRVMALVEEAIRTATVTGEMPGRVVVIRQLDVGTIPLAAPPASIALAVEAAVQRIASNAVSGDDPTAAAAPMIYFKDDASVVLTLAQRIATNKPTTEWFWPSLVKGWTPNPPPDRAIRVLIEQAMSTSAGVVTLAKVVETLASTGVLDKLLERLSESDGRALLKAIGWTQAMTSIRGTGVEVELPAPQMPEYSQRFVQRWVDRWGGNVRDARAFWLGAMLIVADRPARATSPDLPDVVRVWLSSVGEQFHTEPDEDTRKNAAARATERDDLIADARVWLQSHPRSPIDFVLGGAPQPLPLRDSASGATPLERRPHDDEADGDEHSADEPPTWNKPRPTNHAGLLFLVPLLTRVGVPDIIANNPHLIDRDWSSALLLRLARRLGVPREDPAIAWIVAGPVMISHADRALTAEVMRAARIRVRMEAGLTMRQLVHRSGATVATPTDIHVLLHNATADVGVRRAGLDVDPGWVPWLGRAVQFHYLDAVGVSA